MASQDIPIGAGGITDSRQVENAMELSLEELLYSSSSFHAIVKPVSLTMILTALCVVFLQTEDSEQQEEQFSSSYKVFDNTSENQNTATTLGLSLLNALIIVSALAAMTFVIVFLYKYRCLKFLIGYMIFSSAILLGFLGGTMFKVAIVEYELAIDQFSYYFALFNFAIVGTVSIFFQKGIPMLVTQGYLVATSVILAWQLSHFDPWTSWTLLIMLALYDLCAVLTPCGPLKALVNLISQEGSPDMPGLLYEAELPPDAQRPRRPRSQATQRQNTVTTAEENSTSEAPTIPSSASDVSPRYETAMSLPQTISCETDVRSTSFTEASNGVEVSPSEDTTHVSTHMDMGQAVSIVSVAPPPTGRVPLAIAKLYKLPLVDTEEPTRRNSVEPLLVGAEHLSPNELLARQYTTEQLLSEVEAIFPRNGGRIERIESRGHPRFVVKDRHGNVKRVLLVDNQGRVLEECHRSEDDDAHVERSGNNSIKLGLGDFIFYSVLVSKAILYSFTTFAACMLVILAGLGGTLVLLAVYRHALPALPISIFLGVIFYLLTRLLIEPWIQGILDQPFYV